MATKRKKMRPDARLLAGWPFEPATEWLATLPDDRDGLLAAALSAVVDFDAAVMCCDGAGAEIAGDRYEASVWKLNGGTYFGCRANDNAAGCVIERHCAALPGNVPLWGQQGQFVIEVEHIRALVKYKAEFQRDDGPMSAQFEFVIVDLDRTFISETGYRCHFDTVWGGMTVDAVARDIFATMLVKRKGSCCPAMLAPEVRDRLANAPLPDWMAGLDPPARREPATVAVPPGFVLVEAVLPARQAWIVRRWAAQAERVRRARDKPLD